MTRKKRGLHMFAMVVLVYLFYRSHLDKLQYRHPKPPSYTRVELTILQQKLINLYSFFNLPKHTQAIQ